MASEKPSSQATSPLHKELNTLFLLKEPPPSCTPERFGCKSSGWRIIIIHFYEASAVSSKTDF